MSTLPAGYIPQNIVTSTSSSGSLGFILCVKCCRMVDSVPKWQITLSEPIQSDHLDDMVFEAGTVHSRESKSSEVMTVVNLFICLSNEAKILKVSSTSEVPRVSKVQEFQKSQMSQMDPMFKNYQGSYRFPKTQKSKGC